MGQMQKLKRKNATLSMYVVARGLLWESEDLSFSLTPSPNICLNLDKYLTVSFLKWLGGQNN